MTVGRPLAITAAVQAHGKADRGPMRGYRGTCPLTGPGSHGYPLPRNLPTYESAIVYTASCSWRDQPVRSAAARQNPSVHRRAHWISADIRSFSLDRSPSDQGRGCGLSVAHRRLQALISPRSAVEIQEALGADIMMCFDECTPYRPIKSTQRIPGPDRPLGRALQKVQKKNGKALFGITPGGVTRIFVKRRGENRPYRF